jgi:hypothetical protein
MMNIASQIKKNYSSDILLKGIIYNSSDFFLFRGISYCNFSGELPDELGNMTSLKQLYIDGSGFSGPFPSTFSKLKNLNILYSQSRA